MKYRMSFVAITIASTLMVAGPAFAKKPQASGKGGSGLFCKQGGQDAFFPASSFTAKQRAQLKQMNKGRKLRINIPGYGPISCVVY